MLQGCTEAPLQSWGSQSSVELSGQGSFRASMVSVREPEDYHLQSASSEGASGGIELKGRRTVISSDEPSDLQCKLQMQAALDGVSAVNSRDEKKDLRFFLGNIPDEKLDTINQQIPEEYKEKGKKNLNQPKVSTLEDTYQSVKEMLRAGQSMKLADVLAGVLSRDDVEKCVEGLDGQVNSRKVSQAASMLNKTAGWDIGFRQDSQTISSEVVESALSELEHVKLLSSESGIIAPDEAMRKRWGGQYQRDAGRSTVQVCVVDSSGGGREAAHETVVFDSETKKKLLASAGMTKSDIDKHLDELTSKLPEYLMPSDRGFTFILHLLVNQNSGTQINRILFGGYDADKKCFVDGLLKETLGSSLKGMAGTYKSSPRTFKNTCKVTLVDEKRLDVTLSSWYGLWFNEGAPTVVSEGDLSAVQKYTFEKTDDGWKVVGKSFQYEGFSDPKAAELARLIKQSARSPSPEESLDVEEMLKQLNSVEPSVSQETRVEKERHVKALHGVSSAFSEEERLKPLNSVEQSASKATRVKKEMHVKSLHGCITKRDEFDDLLPLLPLIEGAQARYDDRYPASLLRTGKEAPAEDDGR